MTLDDIATCQVRSPRAPCRLAKKGLSDVTTQVTPCRKFMKGAMELEQVVEVLLAERKAQQREDDLYARCAAAAAVRVCRKSG